MGYKRILMFSVLIWLTSCSGRLGSGERTTVELAPELYQRWSEFSVEIAKITKGRCVVEDAPVRVAKYHITNGEGGGIYNRLLTEKERRLEYRIVGLGLSGGGCHKDRKESPPYFVFYMTDSMVRGLVVTRVSE